MVKNVNGEISAAASANELSFNFNVKSIQEYERESAAIEWNDSEELLEKIRVGANEFYNRHKWAYQGSYEDMSPNEIAEELIDKDTCPELLNELGIEWNQHTDYLVQRAIKDAIKEDMNFYNDFKEEIIDTIEDLMEQAAEDYYYEVNGEYGESTDNGNNFMYELPYIDIDSIKAEIVEELEYDASVSDWACFGYDYDSMVEELMEDNFTEYLNDKFSLCFPNSVIWFEIVGNKWVYMYVSKKVAVSC